METTMYFGRRKCAYNIRDKGKLIIVQKYFLAILYKSAIFEHTISCYICTSNISIDAAIYKNQLPSVETITIIPTHKLSCYGYQKSTKS